MAVFAVGFYFAARAIGVMLFNPDSWFYIEMSETVFNGDFYRFHTNRSYFSTEYSAAFPPGYPVALALARVVFGGATLTSGVLNICAAAATVYALFKICGLLNFHGLARLAVACALLLYPQYMDELFAGKAMPLAVLFFVFSFYALLTKRVFLSGVLLGGSALVRFDFLVYALCFQCAVFVLNRKPKDALLSFCGVLLGIAPWVVYSFTRFGEFWVSDNSWVAVSAMKAYVLDYPAAPAVSALVNPGLWLARLFGNIPPLVKSVFSSSAGFPLLYVFLAASLFKWRALLPGAKNKLLLICLFVVLSLFPYLLTGYYDKRYFALVFLVLSVAFIYTAREAKLHLSGFAVLGLLLTFYGGGAYLTDTLARAADYSKYKLPAENRRIAELLACHQKHPDHTLIFSADTLYLTAWYGLTTGMKAASLPTNFERMTDLEKQFYFESMRPYLKVSKTSVGDDECLIN